MEWNLAEIRMSAEPLTDLYDQLNQLGKQENSLTITDWIVPNGRVGDYVNAILHLRNREQAGAYTAELWEQELFASGWELTASTVKEIQFDLEDWLAPIDISDPDRTRIKVLLTQSPPEVTKCLTPYTPTAKITVCLKQITFIAHLR